MKIGVLALQGAVTEHMNMLSRLGVDPVAIKHPNHFNNISGLIIPGGESTTINKLIRNLNLYEHIWIMSQSNLPIMGTCAGLITLASEVEEGYPEPLNILDIKVKRNASGRQVDSFETELKIPEIGTDPFKAVFIRAPYIVNVGKNVTGLAYFQDKVTAVKESNVLACSFHPELTDDTRIHEYFLSLTP